MTENHTGKRHCLLDAAVQLWRQGQALTAMTVQQLAQVAGVGKGTVYEYFSCREELLAQAFLSYMDSRLDALSHSVAGASSFSQAADALFAAASEMLVLQKAVLEAMQLYLRTGHGAQELCAGTGHACQGRRLDGVLLCAAQKGQAEGVLGPCSPCEAIMALKGILVGFVACRHEYPAQDEAALRASAEKLIRRALGPAPHKNV